MRSAFCGGVTENKHLLHSSECGQSHDVEQLAYVSLYSFQQMDAGMEGGEEAGQGFTEYTHPAVVAGQAVGKAWTI